jgi:hypothetical protein
MKKHLLYVETVPPSRGSGADHDVDENGVLDWNIASVVGLFKKLNCLQLCHIERLKI